MKLTQEQEAKIRELLEAADFETVTFKKEILQAAKSRWDRQNKEWKCTIKSVDILKGKVRKLQEKNEPLYVYPADLAIVREPMINTQPLYSPGAICEVLRATEFDSKRASASNEMYQESKMMMQFYHGDSSDIHLLVHGVFAYAKLLGT